ncbi:MAG: virginiamycin lyase, partial [Acidimicrobiaceae bacterium]|nr:virginiamycin lyase [Acidimicrobiaceae bacterium]
MRSWRDELPVDLPREDILAAAVGEAHRRRRRRQHRAALVSAVGIVVVVLLLVANAPTLRNRQPSVPIQGSLTQVVTKSSSVTVPGVSHAAAPPRSAPAKASRSATAIGLPPPLPPSGGLRFPAGAPATTAPPTTLPKQPTLADFALPSPDRQPFGIAPGPNESLWFTEYDAGIARVNPGGSVTEFAVPAAGSGTYGITPGPDGNMWFTEYLAGNIGRITPSGTITEFGVPTANSGPTGITRGGDGTLWFAETTAGKI